jgi:hypothetical protein
MFNADKIKAGKLLIETEPGVWVDGPRIEEVVVSGHGFEIRSEPFAVSTNVLRVRYLGNAITREDGRPVRTVPVNYRVRSGETVGIFFDESQIKEAVRV